MAKTPTPKIVSKKHLARMEREQIQNRYITIVAAVVLVLVVGLVGFGILDQTVLKDSKSVAVVGSERITAKQFQTQVRFTRDQLIRQYQSTAQLAQMFASDPNNASYFEQSLQSIADQLNDPETLGGQVLDRMINDRLVRQEAARRGITVSKEEVEAAMQADFGFYADGTPTPTVTPTAWATSTLSPTQLALVPPTATPTSEPTLAATPTTVPATSTPTVEPTTVNPEATPGPTETPSPTATPYTFEGYQTQVKDTLASMESLGFTEADLYYLEETGLYYQKLEEALTADIETEQEQVWARHILVSDEASAQTVLDRLNQGEDFAALAAELSTDTSNKDAGGDLGWFLRGDMIAEFEDAAFSLQIGEVSQPVQTTHGYHIIQALGHEIRPVAADKLQQVRDNEFQTWLTEAAARDDVKKNDVWKENVPTEPALSAS